MHLRVARWKTPTRRFGNMQVGPNAPMDLFHEIGETRNAVKVLQHRGKTVGLVPTMGALHEGHLSLIRTARAQCSDVAVTIFVNPLQFGPNEDLDAYPRTMEADLAACEAEGVSLVFAPTVETMYPENATTTVHVDGLTTGLCGAHRPGHFDGVTTVVAKLFEILPADRAFFGEKDYQQLVVIKRMVSDLNMSIEIVACPTLREDDGMALSSRNRYLSPEHRAQAGAISRALFDAEEQVRNGLIDATRVVETVRSTIQHAGPCAIDYVELVNATTLVPLSRIDPPARLCVAVRIGGCRLIDNIAIGAP